MCLKLCLQGSDGFCNPLILFVFVEDGALVIGVCSLFLLTARVGSSLSICLLHLCLPLFKQRHSIVQIGELALTGLIELL